MWPQKEISLVDLESGLFRLVDPCDPDFWTKAKYFTVEVSGDPEKELTSHYTYYTKVTEFLGQLEVGKGYVYILTCPSQPGICKIGSTRRTPAERLKEINTATGVIVPWILADAIPCQIPEDVEKEVHRKLAESRINSKKEGFAIQVDDAKKVVLEVVENLKVQI